MLAQHSTQPLSQIAGEQDLAGQREGEKKPQIEVRYTITPPTLVVDLDRALVQSDSLSETVGELIAPPLAKLGTFPGLSSLKGVFERKAADSLPRAPSELPYDESVLELVRAARADGRRTALVSAAGHQQAAAVAEHLGLFDEAVESASHNTGSEELAGSAKADMIESRYGTSGYDYVGHGTEDLPVWSRARQAIAVRPSRQLRIAAEARGIHLAEVGERPARPIWPLLKAMRPHQWAKNLLILLPIIASHDFNALGTALLAMVAFSLIASSVYILNDLVDLPSDRAHPRKRRRPFASGEAQIPHGIGLAAFLIVAAFGLSLALLPGGFVAILLLYLSGTVAYTFWLKRKLLVDIIALAGLYTARILAGGAATGIALSPWLLAFSMFLFFSLATIKRQAELVDQERTGRSATLGRAYFTDDLPTVRIMAVSSGQAAVLVLALYINSPATVGLYAQPSIMWLLCPILFYWLGRMELMTHRGFMDDDPIVFACRDGISLLCFLATIIVVLAAMIGY